MKEIFVSHAVADRPLAELFVDFLVDAVGVPAESIFCSSLLGHGTPLTHDFNDDIKIRIADPALVVLLMTPAYMESSFCLMELGAAWSRGHKTLPIVVPPISFDHVVKTLDLRQSWLITNGEALQNVRKTVLEVAGVPGRDNTAFDRKRRKWEADLPGALARLAKPARVPRSELEEAQAALDVMSKRYTEGTAKIASLQRQLAYPEPGAGVLIIESEPLISDDLSILVSSWGFSVAGVARTESEAINISLRSKADLILAEIVLSDGSSGLAAVRAILSFSDAYPIFVTAYPEKLLGADRPDRARLVTKPFAPDTLLQEVKQAYHDLVSARAAVGAS